MDGEYLSHLRFADDYSYTPHELQQMLQELVDESEYVFTCTYLPGSIVSPFHPPSFPAIGRLPITIRAFLPSEKRRDSVIGWCGGSCGDRSVTHFIINFCQATWARPSLLHLVKRRSQVSMSLVNTYFNSKNIEYIY